ncbi:MAG TPA: ATP-binding protein, partial [Candidatus Anaerotignum merdipullorum]|nr:ATP-binding protein [Candidatus Anaerotignum merdipullorum]
DILDELAGNPLKFILFIDDLSFSNNDDNFSALKAILEGGVASCGKNVLIYATSNRRHLVKESMTQRQGDDLHLNDTLQETMSLAARFGLTVTFQKPNKDAYLDIVKHLALQYGIHLPEQELFTKAEAFAIRCNGRSPRAAKHFIELQKAGI